MLLSELKGILNDTDTVRFALQNGEEIPAHFHVTEVGQVTKHFIDCGGTVRKEERITMQLWSSIDVMHRLSGNKLVSIINASEGQLHLPDLEVEIEYQTSTIGRYSVEWQKGQFILVPTATDCLAKEQCGIVPIADTSVPLACTPGGGCC